MALNIKRKDTERKIRMLAQRTNLSVTDVIERAADRWSADLDRETGVKEDLAEFRAWRGTFPPTPPGVTSKMLMDELYDDNGLPC